MGKSEKHDLIPDYRGPVKPLKELDVMDNFLLGELLNGPDGKAFIRILLNTVLGRQVDVREVINEAPLTGLYRENRSIRLDALINAGDGKSLILIHLGKIRSYMKYGTASLRIRS